MGYDIVIVGSGVGGLAAAYRLAPDHDVLVIDRGGIGQGTSSRASGVITPTVDYPGLTAWSAHAMAFFRELDGTGVFSFTDREFVRGVHPADEETAAATEAAADDASLVAADEYDEMYDDDAPYSRALVFENAGYFDVDDFLATMRDRAARRGVEFRPDTTVESVLVDGGTAGGVETEYGRVDADHVVVAAGSATPALLADVLPLPIRKFTWNVAYLDAGLPDGYPMGGDPRLGAYWRRTRDDHLLVGIEHGYETTPTDADAEREIGDRLRSIVTDELPSRLAHVDETTAVVRYEVCPMADATTPDARGIIDAPAEGPDDLVVAAGFHGAGVMAADSIGTAVRSLVTGEETPFSLDPFALDRFETRGTDFPMASLFPS